MAALTASKNDLLPVDEGNLSASAVALRGFL